LPGQRWTRDQVGSLLHQVIVERKSLSELRIEGKTLAAINNQRQRLKRAGALDHAFVGRKLVPWTIGELRQLQKLTAEYGFSADCIAQLQLIPGRSKFAISKMMGRHGLGNPLVKARAQQASRLTGPRRRELEQFLLNAGRFASNDEVARQWGLAKQTIAAYRRRLGIPLSWREARSFDGYRTERRKRDRAFSAHMRQRWMEWRARLQQRLYERKQELERLPNALARRSCRSCGERWFATNEFFHVQVKNRGKSYTFSMSHTCRMCRSHQRRERARLLRTPGDRYETAA